MKTAVADSFERNPQFDLEDRLLRFAANVIRLTDQITPTKAGTHVCGQLLRSGTSVLPNHGEAQAAESPADFIHKMHVCLKELRETRRWIRLLIEVPLLEKPSKAEPLLDETQQLIKIFAASIRTSRSRLANQSKTR